MFIPMKAIKVERVISPERMLCELKYDGERATIQNTENGTRIFNSSGKEITYRYPELWIDRDRFNGFIQIDGEVVMDKGTTGDFQKLQGRTGLQDKYRINLLAQKHPVHFITFDLLWFKDECFIKRPLEDRKQHLALAMQTCHIFSNTQYHISPYQDYTSISEKAKEAIEKAGFEGLMLKDRNSLYEPDTRSDKWLKEKFLKDIDVVVIGYTDGKENGRRDRPDMFGALVVGVYDINGKIKEIGKVGTGFDEYTIRQLKRNLKPVWSDGTVTWVKPEVVAKVKYLNFTNEGNLRQPSFKAWRTDKPVEECVLTA